MSSKYFPPYESASNNIKVQLDLTKYATKDDVKNITHESMVEYTKVNVKLTNLQLNKF